MKATEEDGSSQTRKLLAKALRYVRLNEPIYSQLETMLTLAIQHPSFPDIALSDEQFILFERLLIETDELEEAARTEALRIALYHLRETLKMDPYALPPLKANLNWCPLDCRFLFDAMGVLAIAWQINQGGELVLSLKTYLRIHPQNKSRPTPAC